MDSNLKTLDLIVQQNLLDHQAAVSQLASSTPSIVSLASKIHHTFCTGRKVLIFGNGGSAADAQHIAAEIVGRFMNERVGLPCIALTTDSSILTAVANDYGFEHIFSRQINALACDGDLVIGISTSGNSKNVVNAIVSANKKGCFTACLTGKSGGILNSHCDLSIQAPSENTATIQECHILIGHTLCSIVDSLYVAT